MMLRVLQLAALTLLLSAWNSTLKSQAFNTFNNRNHPEIEWLETETPHFRIMYGKHLAGIELEAAAIAESTYEALSGNLGITFDRKIKIYLSDEDEITNGAATFLYDSYTFIWVEINEAPDVFSGDRKWLRKVLAHELAHLFNFEAVKSNMNLWGFLFGEAGSRSFAEGYAQYSTEFWDAQRGDRWLRSAIFNDQPSENDGSTPLNGRLIYAKGFSQLLYISEQYGDSTISKMMAWRDTLGFGLTYPDIYKGFEKTTGEKWSDFENRWLKHMNIYYNTLAGQMDRTDSLKGKKVEIDGLLMFDFESSPSGKSAVSTSYISNEFPVIKNELLVRDSTGFRPKRTLFLGSKNDDFAWSADENTLYYSKNDYATNSSLVNDLYAYSIKTGKTTKLSNGMRLAFPNELNREVLLAVQNQNGTGNVVQFDVAKKQISAITNFKGDVQLLHLTLNQQKTKIAFTKIDENGNRTIEVMDLQTREIKSYTEGQTDDRNPKFSPKGDQIAFTSLRDNVPNVFVINLDDHTIERATHVFTGAELFDWASQVDSSITSKWILKSIESKAQEQFLVSSDTLRAVANEIQIAPDYSKWTKAAPKNQIDGFIAPKPELILSTKSYSHLKNVQHFLSFGLPYVDNSTKNGDYGIQGVTIWGDPLGKHSFTALGNLSFTNQDLTYGIASYINRTQSFNWSVDAYRIPGAIQFYTDNLLVSTLAGFSLGLSQDLDWKPKDYSYSRYFATTRAFKWEPGTTSLYSTSMNLGFSDAWQNDVIVAYEIKHLLPYVFNDVHPLKGYGMNISLKSGVNASDSWFGNNQNSFAIVDFRWFDVRQIYKEITFFHSFRAQRQFGDPLPFEAVQLSQYDNFNLPALAQLPLSTWNTPDRVRGFRTFILSDELYFSSAEIRLPLLPTLGTQILGLISFDKTTLAFFSDVAFANNITFGSTSNSVWQWGLGAEIKNKMSFFGLPIVQALGYAQPHDKLFAPSPYDVYYRIQASIPF